ncbi:MAG: DUF4124 domain-containing protein, partial [Nitrospinae bacterium]|nr:DUF4124 domain-containing protein [Nitrospinota bacterium]
MTKSISFLVAVCCWVVVLQTALVQAKIYKWKDEQGKVHFTDSLSKIPSQYRQGRGFETLKEVPANSEFGVNLRLPVKISREHV